MTLPELERAALSKQCVIVPSDRCWHRRCPAAFIINLPGLTLLHLFRRGMFIYTPKSK